MAKQINDALFQVGHFPSMWNCTAKYRILCSFATLLYELKLPPHIHPLFCSPATNNEPSQPNFTHTHTYTYMYKYVYIYTYMYIYRYISGITNLPYLQVSWSTMWLCITTFACFVPKVNSKNFGNLIPSEEERQSWIGLGGYIVVFQHPDSWKVERTVVGVSSRFSKVKTGFAQIEYLRRKCFKEHVKSQKIV